MNLVVADDIGLVKEVCFPAKEASYVANTSGADSGVISMCWLNESETAIVISRESGAIEIYGLSEMENRWSCRNSITIEDEVANMVVVDEFSKLVVLTDTGVITYTIDGFAITQSSLVCFEDGPYDVVAFMKGGSKVVAAKGSECPVTLDMATGRVSWKGKNAGHTPLQIKSVFQIESLASISARIFAAGDQKGRIRMFDIESAKKPLFELPVYDLFTLSNQYQGTGGMGQVRPIKKLVPSPDSTLLYVGDTFGAVFAIDIQKAISSQGKLVNSVGQIGFKDHVDCCRKLFPMKSSCKGVMGSVRGIHVTETTVFVVSAGRYAYSFDIKSKGKKDSFKMFLKQKLTCALVCTKRNGVENIKDDEIKSEESDSDFDDELANDVLGDLENTNELIPMFRNKQPKKKAKKTK